eukprot:914957_1
MDHIFLVVFGDIGHQLLFWWPPPELEILKDPAPTIRRPPLVRPTNPYSLPRRPSKDIRPEKAVPFAQQTVYGYHPKVFAKILTTKRAISHQVLELSIDDLRFLSFPVHLPTYSDHEITFFSVVLALPNDIQIETTHNLHNSCSSTQGNSHSQCMLRERGGVYANIARRLSLAIEHEQVRCGFLSAQFARIDKIKLDLQQRDPEATIYTLNAHILSACSLACTLRDVCDGLTARHSAVRTRVNGALTVHCSLVDPRAHPLTPIRPYQTLILLIGEEGTRLNSMSAGRRSSPDQRSSPGQSRSTEVKNLLESLPSDANPSLKKLLLGANATKSFQELSLELAIPLPHLFELAAHLTYWGVARVAPALKKHNVYSISPHVRLEDGAHLPLLVQFSGPALPLHAHMRPMVHSHSQKQGFLGKVIWLLQRRMLVQLHTFVCLVEEKEIAIRYGRSRTFDSAWRRRDNPLELNDESMSSGSGTSSTHGVGSSSPGVSRTHITASTGVIPGIHNKGGGQSESSPLMLPRRRGVTNPPVVNLQKSTRHAPDYSSARNRAVKQRSLSEDKTRFSKSRAHNTFVANSHTNNYPLRQPTGSGNITPTNSGYGLPTGGYTGQSGSKQTSNGSLNCLPSGGGPNGPTGGRLSTSGGCHAAVSGNRQSPSGRGHTTQSASGYTTQNGSGQVRTTGGRQSYTAQSGGGQPGAVGSRQSSGYTAQSGGGHVAPSGSRQSTTGYITQSGGGHVAQIVGRHSSGYTVQSGGDHAAPTVGRHSIGYTVQSGGGHVAPSGSRQSTSGYIAQSGGGNVAPSGSRHSIGYTVQSGGGHVASSGSRQPFVGTGSSSGGQLPRATRSPKTELDDAVLAMLFKRLCSYFDGRHHLEEIMWRESVSSTDLKQVLDAYSGVLVQFQHPEPGFSSGNHAFWHASTVNHEE